MHSARINSSYRGFTIVELLIVIVVIAILASITIVAYNGIQTRATNTARYNEIKAWQKSFELYKATYGNYPAVADGGYCLGYNFPSGTGGAQRCRDFNTSTGGNSYLESDNTALMNEIRKISDIPSGPRTAPRGGGTVGPYAIYNSWNVILYTVVEGGDASACESGTTLAWTNGNQTAICGITLSRS
ncbi:prepilin-type N-terminal cleavage/methylation domain-containing protein [Candidatus Saccharibacteria bacterium]|nr:prepilin-type N-terminal cleavage/methylation domain-containing protein [Candidatus Saccharibacteria bacterium]